PIGAVHQRTEVQWWSSCGFRGLTLLRHRFRRTYWSRALKELSKGLGEPRRVGQTVLRRQDNQTEFWHGTAFCLQVNGLDKKECILQRHDQEISSNHRRSLLIPEGQL